MPPSSVEPDEQSARALDDHGSGVETGQALDVRRHGRDLDALASGGGVGCERLVEHGPLLDVDAG